jgi:hypothetical protein
MCQLAYVKYCQFIILTFGAGLLWVMGFWAVEVMPDNGILSPLPCPVGLAKVGTRKQRKDSDVGRT